MILKSLSEPLIDYFQKFLESKNVDGTLVNFINHRKDADAKLLLLIWLNDHINFHHVKNDMVTLLEHYFDGKNPSEIIKYAHSMVGGIWNDQILKHNLELFKTL
jgi:hypothetical protein